MSAYICNVFVNALHDFSSFRSFGKLFHDCSPILSEEKFSIICSFKSLKLILYYKSITSNG